VNVLVDSSVWIAHFRKPDATLAELLEQDQVLVHPMVLAELACGTPPEPRARTLDDVSQLRPCRQATLAEVMDFIDREKIYGLGCGVADMHLLASTLVTPSAKLWTRDKRLSGLADRFGIAYQ
jgi:predicted nucleic acid-binding protein